MREASIFTYIPAPQGVCVWGEGGGVQREGDNIFAPKRGI